MRTPLTLPGVRPRPCRSGSVRSTAVAVLLLLGSALATAAAQTASAVPRQGCTARGCNELDPVTEGCDGDAVTIDAARATIGDMHVDLRYSYSCKASWARGAHHTTPDLRTILVAPHGASDGQVESNDHGSQFIYSKMVDGTSPDFVRIYPRRGDFACGNQANPSQQ
ncbi:DUF2690 domain-containing protein [Kitasatospora sp. NPDC048722]|uniref:DUF2690 domain-containing protein n=1 Tax=Kitasatospora sp. NPDC048722 TaxID=3155639 RepID=UPI0033EDFF9F